LEQVFSGAASSFFEALIVPDHYEDLVRPVEHGDLLNLRIGLEEQVHALRRCRVIDQTWAATVLEKWCFRRTSGGLLLLDDDRIQITDELLRAAVEDAGSKFAVEVDEFRNPLQILEKVKWAALLLARSYSWHHSTIGGKTAQKAFFLIQMRQAIGVTSEVREADLPSGTRIVSDLPARLDPTELERAEAFCKSYDFMPRWALGIPKQATRRVAVILGRFPDSNPFVLTMYPGEVHTARWPWEATSGTEREASLAHYRQFVGVRE
jgi:hypothetical protein